LAEDRLKLWETLFQRALLLIDSASKNGAALDDWSFGGGTVLMRRHHHRFSKDIDIFVSDPQCLPYLSPRLNDKAESLTSDYVEQAGFLKLNFQEGEIDFVASAPLTENATVVEILFGREVLVETSSEIIAKKVWHRGDQFTARDIFDLALVAEKEPEALWKIRPILRDRREAILARVGSQKAVLQETFSALDVLDYQRSFEECVELTIKALG
jgi:predicted nucleotidyltransferase component of viral defense system